MIYEAAILGYDGYKWFYGTASENNDSAHPDAGKIEASGIFATRREAITPIGVGDDIVALHFHTGFLAASVLNDTASAHGNEIGDSEKFRVVQNKDGTLSFRNVWKNKFLRVSSHGGAEFKADELNRHADEKFTPVLVNDRLCLKASNGMFLSSFPKHPHALRPGALLEPGMKLSSPDGRYVLTMQTDGNLVWQKGSKVLWHSGTCGTTDASCVMQADGNFVIYGDAARERKPVHSSDTANKQGAYLTCQSDGNLVLYQDGKPIWASDTAETSK